MRKNLNSLKSMLTLQTTKKAFQNYFEQILPFLQRENSDKISYISFNNYFSLCSFITSKIYNLFLRTREQEQNIIDQKVCIEGFFLFFIMISKVEQKWCLNYLILIMMDI